MNNRLAALRKKARLTQKALSVRSGVSQDYVELIEQKGKVPGIDIAAALARALGVAPLQIFPRLPRSEKETRWEFFVRVYPELVGALNDTDRLRFFIAISTMEESGFRAMTSIVNPTPMKWDRVRENLFARLKILVRDADLVGLMGE